MSWNKTVRRQNPLRILLEALINTNLRARKPERIWLKSRVRTIETGELRAKLMKFFLKHGVFETTVISTYLLQVLGALESHQNMFVLPSANQRLFFVLR